MNAIRELPKMIKGNAAEKSRQYSEVNKNRRHPTSKSEKEVNKNATIQA